MARSRFRSQPALQRSGGRATTTLLGFCLVVATAAGAGALVSMAMRSLDDWANTPPARAERVAHSPAAPAPTATPPVATHDVQPAATESEEAHAVTRVRSTTARSPKPSKPLKPLLPQLGAPRERWEDQQQEYQLAKSAYDASERAEGFRWAQQYKVRTRRYCRALEKQRTAAFMEGCLSYAAGAKPRDATGSSGADPG